MKTYVRFLEKKNSALVKSCRTSVYRSITMNAALLLCTTNARICYRTYVYSTISSRKIIARFSRRGRRRRRRKSDTNLVQSRRRVQSISSSLITRRVNLIARDAVENVELFSADSRHGNLTLILFVKTSTPNFAVYTYSVLLES